MAILLILRTLCNFLYLIVDLCQWLVLIGCKIIVPKAHNNFYVGNNFNNDVNIIDLPFQDQNDKYFI